MAKNFIWTTLKAIFSILSFYLHPQIQDLQIIVYCQNLSFEVQNNVINKLENLKYNDEVAFQKVISTIHKLQRIQPWFPFVQSSKVTSHLHNPSHFSVLDWHNIHSC